MLTKFSSGISRVFNMIIPPAKSPGKLGCAALITIKLSNMAEGNKSKANDLRSGSVLGNTLPFTKAILYLSLSPRITANLPSVIVVPLIRFSTSPVFLSGLLLIISREITSAGAIFFCWKAKTVLRFS